MPFLKDGSMQANSHLAAEADVSPLNAFVKPNKREPQCRADVNILSGPHYWKHFDVHVGY